MSHEKEVFHLGKATFSISLVENFNSALVFERLNYLAIIYLILFDLAYPKCISPNFFCKIINEKPFEKVAQDLEENLLHVIPSKKDP